MEEAIAEKMVERATKLGLQKSPRPGNAAKMPEKKKEKKKSEKKRKRSDDDDEDEDDDEDDDDDDDDDKDEDDDDDDDDDDDQGRRRKLLEGGRVAKIKLKPGKRKRKLKRIPDVTHEAIVNTLISLRNKGKWKWEKGKSTFPTWFPGARAQKFLRDELYKAVQTAEENSGLKR